MFTTFSLAVILDCTVRIVLGTALGALIGLERQLRARSAGIRTNALVALGSTLFVLVSEMAVAGGSSGDPTRVAAQVASGIGFLGAGVILKHGASVSGLNTAATLWASAAVGTLTGSGDLVIAIIGAVMVVLANPLFRAIGSFIDRRRSINDYETVGHEYTFEVRCLQQHEVKIRSWYSMRCIARAFPCVLSPRPTCLTTSSPSPPCSTPPSATMRTSRKASRP